MRKNKKEIDLNTILNEDQDNLEKKDKSINSVKIPELSQEAKNIFIALDEYVEKHNGDAFFHVDFGAYDKSGDVVDDRYDVFGCTDVLIISLEEILKVLKETED